MNLSAIKVSDRLAGFSSVNDLGCHMYLKN